MFIVDDDESARRTFASPQEFLEVDRPEGACCLVLDVRMSGMTGLEVQKQLAQRGLEMPVIFMTGHGRGQPRAQTRPRLAPVRCRRCRPPRWPSWCGWRRGWRS